LTTHAEIVAEVPNVIANVGKVQVRLLLELLHIMLHLLLKLLHIMLHLLLKLLHILPHLLLELLHLLLHLLLELLLLLRLLLHLLLELLLLLRLLLHLLLELLELLHNKIALSNRAKVYQISHLTGNFLESMCEARKIWLWTELKHRLMRIDVRHGFESWEYDSGECGIK
jgi:hypothetical protein